MPEQQVTLPAALQPLFAPARYKFVRGGRGSGKSWGVSRALLVQAASTPHRVLCAREVQVSIRQSVHQLLSDQIEALGLGAFFTVMSNEIRGRNGSTFSFRGLSDLTADSIKSFEGCTRVWLEEAQTISARSWHSLAPTIRAPGSEIWATYNPELETDETHQRAVVHPHPDTVSIVCNWRDNPWFPPELESERRHALATMPTEEYEHVWGGQCRPAVEGEVRRIGDRAEGSLALSEVRLLAPVPRPGKIFAIGLNYADHAKEAGMAIPAEPILFNKWTTSICGPNDDTMIPKGSTKLDYEVELGVVEQALLVPQQGVTRKVSGAATALVVGADDRVERRVITVDRAIGNRWQVTQGLQAGDRLLLCSDGLWGSVTDTEITDQLARNAISDAVPARTTPSMVMIDGQGRVIYQGALDEVPEQTKPDGKDHISAALDDLKAGRAIRTPETRAYSNEWTGVDFG